MILKEVRRFAKPGTEDSLALGIAFMLASVVLAPICYAWWSSSLKSFLWMMANDRKYTNGWQRALAWYDAEWSNVSGAIGLTVATVAMLSCATWAAKQYARNKR